MTIAREIFEFHDHGDRILDVSYLDHVADEKYKNFKEDTTIWIFEDKSALQLNSNEWEIIDEYNNKI